MLVYNVKFYSCYHDSMLTLAEMFEWTEIIRSAINKLINKSTVDKFIIYLKTLIHSSKSVFCHSFIQLVTTADRSAQHLFPTPNAAAYLQQRASQIIIFSLREY